MKVPFFVALAASILIFILLYYFERQKKRYERAVVKDKFKRLIIK